MHKLMDHIFWKLLITEHGSDVYMLKVMGAENGGWHLSAKKIRMVVMVEIQ